MALREAHKRDSNRVRKAIKGEGGKGGGCISMVYPSS